MALTSPPYKFVLGLVGDTVADLPSGTDYPVDTLFLDKATADIYVNDGTTFNPAGGGGGSGTVTDVTSGDSSVLVTNPTTTPDLSVQDSPAVGGVTVTGTPSAGQVLTATDATDADWETPSSASSWGEAITATFSGSGSPVGFVTPSGEGDLYVDDTTPALWQATGTSNTDWQLVGGPGGGVSVAALAATAITGQPVAGGATLDLQAQAVIPVDAVSQTYGTWVASLTMPLTVIGAASVVLTMEPVSVGDVDTTHDDYDIGVSVVVQSADGSNCLTLTGAASATAGGPGDSASIPATGLTPTAVTGTDLSYDASTGEVSSTLGGTYSAMIVAVGGWD